MLFQEKAVPTSLSQRLCENERKSSSLESRRKIYGELICGLLGFKIQEYGVRVSCEHGSWFDALDEFFGKIFSTSTDLIRSDKRGDHLCAMTVPQQQDSLLGDT